MQLDIVLPHQYEVLQDPEDPHGDPLAACWRLRPDSFHDEPQHYQNPQEKADFLVVDHQGFWYFNLRNGSFENPEKVDYQPHGLDMFPGSVLRLWKSYDRSWWGHFPHQRLIDGTITVGFINTTMHFVRKAQNKKLLTAIGAFDTAGKRQKQDPEMAVEIQAESPAQVQIDALDFDTSPTNFIDHALWVIQNMAEAYGAQSIAMAKGVSSTQFAEGRFHFSHDVLTEVRNEQIPFCRVFEHDLAFKMVSVARGSTPKTDDDNGIGGTDPMVRKDLPDPEKLRDGYSVEFPKLARSYANPDQEAKHRDWRMKVGADSQFDVIRQENPNLSMEQVVALTIEKLQEQALVNDLKSRRGLPNDGESVTAPEAMGRLGPQVRDAKQAMPAPAPPQPSQNQE